MARTQKDLIPAFFLGGVEVGKGDTLEYKIGKKGETALGTVVEIAGPANIKILDLAGKRGKGEPIYRHRELFTRLVSKASTAPVEPKTTEQILEQAVEAGLIALGTDHTLESPATINFLDELNPVVPEDLAAAAEQIAETVEQAPEPVADEEIKETFPAPVPAPALTDRQQKLMGFVTADPITRQDLMKASGFSKSTVGDVTKELVGLGLIVQHSAPGQANTYTLA